TLVTTPYIVSSASNRIGARLSGRPLDRATTGDLPSEGLVEGAVQVPADGQPLIFLADHPTIGGYPVLAVVDPDDLPPIAQPRPDLSLALGWPRGASYLRARERIRGHLHIARPAPAESRRGRSLSLPTSCQLGSQQQRVPPQRCPSLPRRRLAPRVRDSRVRL